MINDENIITEGITNAIIKSKYKFESKDVIVNLKNEELISEKKTKIEDNDFNVYFLEKFKFIVKKDLLKGVELLQFLTTIYQKVIKYSFQTP